jgi:predicted nucleic acid-binding Zn ribbon protein
MPAYAFRCPKCNNEVELVMSITEYSKASTKPVCVLEGCDGQQEMVSIPVLTSFQLKGTGWTGKSEHNWGAPTDIAMPRKRR